MKIDMKKMNIGAHAEHIKSFMRNELITVYGLPDEEAEDYAGTRSRIR